MEHIIQLISIIFGTLIFTYFTAKIDDEHQEKNENFKDHNSRFWQRLFSVLLCGIANIHLGLIAGFTFWLLFDQFKNRVGKVKQPLFYLGTQSKSDKFFKNNLFLYLCLKVFILITIITLIYLWLR